MGGIKFFWGPKKPKSAVSDASVFVLFVLVVFVLVSSVLYRTVTAPRKRSSILRPVVPKRAFLDRLLA